MNFQCPQCKSENTKDIQAEVGYVRCMCLDCNNRFNRNYTVEERDNFNN